MKSEVRSPKSEVRGARWATALLGALLVAVALPASAQGLPAANEAQLLAVLQSDASRKEKSDACLVLARIATKESVPVIAALLPSAELNHMARYVLETLPDPAAGAALREALGSTSGRQLAGVVTSLGVRRDPAAESALARLLSNPDPDVAQAAARSLGSIGTPGAVRALQGALGRASGDMQWNLCEGLLRAAELRLEALEPAEAAAIYDALRQVPSAPAHVRAAALRGAILARGPAGVPMLVEAVRSSDFVLVNAAIRAALELPGQDASTALAGELPRLSDDHRILIIQTLAQRGHAAALPALAAAAREGDSSVRLVAVRGMTQLGSPAAASELATLLNDPERPISQAAQDGLASLPGAEADAVVLALLNDADTARRLVALEVLGRRRVAAAVPVLWTRATDSDARVRAAALRRVSEQADPGELLRMLNLLSQTTAASDLALVGQALGTLAIRAGDANTTATVLGGRLGKLQPAQEAALLGAIGEVGGPRALEHVRAALKSGDATVRQAALETLAGWRTFDAAPDLLQLATTATDSDTAATAFGGCVRLCMEAEAPSAERFQVLQSLAPAAKTTAQKRRLLSALGEIASVPSLKMVATFLEQPELVNEAGAAAVKICSRLDAASRDAAAPVLRQVLVVSTARPVLDGARKQMQRLGIPAN